MLNFSLPTGRFLLSGGMFLVAIALIWPASAGWRDMLDKVIGGGETSSAAERTTSAATSAAPTSQEQETGLRAAISGFADAAIKRLGQEGGFANDPLVRIPVPQQLQSLKSGMAKIGQESVFNDFEASMNRAAENAVKDAAPVFVDAVSNMSISDAANIIGGADNAATEYFRSKTSDGLRQRLRPQIEKVTGEAGVTSYYKSIVDKAGFLASYLNKDTLDLDGYVTEESLNGLFAAMAEEEKRLRANPLGATSDIVRKVFGWFK
ncbi:MAG: DUF4197 domain-containing protein [Gammaproteobacteria bacterium]|nr:DUF4197 domain-containing protein [Gammaproteobacteria bacterium]